MARRAGHPGALMGSLNMKRILAAVDRSDASLRAADLGADLARRYGAELVLLTVGRDVGAPDPGMEEFAHMEHIREPAPTLALEALRDGLETVRDRAMEKGARTVLLEAVAGDPAEEIVAFAKDDGADLIVVGSRGHGRLAGLLLGSVAQKVLAHAHCPVLVVR